MSSTQTILRYSNACIESDEISSFVSSTPAERAKVVWIGSSERASTSASQVRSQMKHHLNVRPEGDLATKAEDPGTCLLLGGHSLAFLYTGYTE